MENRGHVEEKLAGNTNHSHHCVSKSLGLEKPPLLAKIRKLRRVSLPAMTASPQSLGPRAAGKVLQECGMRIDRITNVTHPDHMGPSVAFLQQKLAPGTGDTVLDLTCLNVEAGHRAAGHVG